MQSGKIKKWNQDKGYGFIDADNQSEDVFFHVSNVRLSPPITIGQRVYFNSERNHKNQLRATEVTSVELSILESSESNLPNNLSNNTSSNKPKKYSQSTHHSNRSSNNNHNSRARPNKKSSLSTLVSLLAIIAVAVYFFADLKSSFFAEDLSATTGSQTSSEQANARSITGDAQIDNTIALIQQGGPFPYPNKDGTTFGNRESRLPAQSQGYYREYTVPTPGVSHRGTRRIVTGGNPPTVYYLTVDHYDSFSRLEVN